MKTIKNILLGTSILGLSISNLYAGTLVCPGKVAELAYHSSTDANSGRLMIRLSSMNNPVFFCSPDKVFTAPGTSQETGPESCKTLYSTFLAAQIAGRSISTMYFDGSQVPQTCNSWKVSQQANIRFFSLSQ